MASGVGKPEMCHSGTEIPSDNFCRKGLSRPSYSVVTFPPSLPCYKKKKEKEAKSPSTPALSSSKIKEHG